MKRILFAFIAVLAICSCAKENAPTAEVVDESTNEVKLIPMSFTVTSEAIKTTMDENRVVSFLPGESISVFCNGNNYKFTTTAGGTAAVFEGLGEVADTYYALFPYSSSATIEGGIINNVNISTSSASTHPGTYASSKAVAVAVTNGSSLSFKNVCALLKITVPSIVTDLCEVVIWSCNESGTDDAISGTFSVNTNNGATPSISGITSPTYQAGLIGPSGKSVALAPGDYYIPVLPASLTKGIHMKCEYLDSFVSRGFNGNAMTLVSKHVYNLGSVVKTDEFTYSSFDNNSIPSEITDADGKTAKISVIANPYSTSENSSPYVLKNDHSSNSGATSGLIKFDLTTDVAKAKFPYAARGKFKKIQVKVYLGTNKYYPRFDLGIQNTTVVLPSRINGTAVSGQEAWDDAVKSNDWNILEWDASAVGKSNFGSLDKFGLRFFLTYDKDNMPKADGTSNHVVYVDDIKFIL